MKIGTLNQISQTSSNKIVEIRHNNQSFKSGSEKIAYPKDYTTAEIAESVLADFMKMGEVKSRRKAVEQALENAGPNEESVQATYKKVEVEDGKLNLVNKTESIPVE